MRAFVGVLLLAWGVLLLALLAITLEHWLRTNVRVVEATPRSEDGTSEEGGRDE